MKKWFIFLFFFLPAFCIYEPLSRVLYWRDEGSSV